MSTALFVIGVLLALGIFAWLHGKYAPSCNACCGQDLAWLMTAEGIYTRCRTCGSWQEMR
jgi:hypothetical protein